MPRVETFGDNVKALLIDEFGDPVSVASSVGHEFADVSVASLSAGQAAGTTTVLAANASRKALMVNPPADCTLLIASAAGSTQGYPLFGNVPNTITGQECPTNALYVYGLSAANALTIWEA